MSRIIKRVVCVIMVLVMAMSLCACSKDPNCGLYVCKDVTVGDLTVPAQEGATPPFVNGASIELKTAGACTVNLDGAQYEGSWKSNDNGVTITLEGTESTGTISGNILSIDLYSVGMQLSFEKK
jgi:ABC-type phosphate transport system substrate-binding protein